MRWLMLLALLLPATTGAQTAVANVWTSQIAENSGFDDVVVVDRMVGGTGAYGFDASRSTYVDLIDAGIFDPTKVVRSALENAVSVASVLLTEATLTEIPEQKAEQPTATEMMP
jgi:chaperonin GroEL